MILLCKNLLNESVQLNINPDTPFSQLIFHIRQKSNSIWTFENEKVIKYLHNGVLKQNQWTDIIFDKLKNNDTIHILVKSTTEKKKQNIIDDIIRVCDCSEDKANYCLFLSNGSLESAIDKYYVEN
jgi:predicted type IV restriction endonuclease